MMFPNLDITTLKFLDIFPFFNDHGKPYRNINIEINVLFMVKWSIYTNSQYSDKYIFRYKYLRFFKEIFKIKITVKLLLFFLFK